MLASAWTLVAFLMSWTYSVHWVSSSAGSSHPYNLVCSLCAAGRIAYTHVSIIKYWVRGGSYRCSLFCLTGRLPRGHALV